MYREWWTPEVNVSMQEKLIYPIGVTRIRSSLGVSLVEDVDKRSQKNDGSTNF